MTDDAFRATVETIAREAAMKHYQRKFPRCHGREAWEFANQNWRQFVEVAADVLALLEALDEAEEAAPNN